MQMTSGIIRGPQKIVVYGPEGIGKSTFASKFPNSIFIDTEGSTKMLDVVRTPKPSSWTMLLEQVKYFKTHPGAVTSTLVIDTADWAEMLCVEHVCATKLPPKGKEINGIEDFGYGKGYTYLAEEFGRLLNLLEELIQQGMNVVMTAHAKMRKFEQPDEMGSYDRWEMKLGKNTFPLVKEWADMVLFANYKTYVVNVDNQGAQKGKNKAQGGKRVMYTAHHPCWDAKNRHGLAEELPFDYAEIAHCIPASDILTRDTVSKPAETPAAPKAPEPPKEVKKAELPKPALADSGIPKALFDLMTIEGVTEAEIQDAVSFKGYYPKNTPIKNYDTGFINGVLIAAWPQVFDLIKDLRTIPIQ